MMLIQLHHQFKNGKTTMVAQRELQEDIQIRKFIDDVSLRHPLPKGAEWLICTPASHHFVMAVKND
jgi:hypothetical protein